MIKTTMLYVFLVLSGSPPSVSQFPMPNLDVCVQEGLSYMVSPADNPKNLPYKQAFLCEETVMPSQ